MLRCNGPWSPAATAVVAAVLVAASAPARSQDPARAGDATPATAPGAASEAPAPSATPPVAARFFIRAIQVKGNTLLPPRQVDAIVYPFMGPNRSPDDVESARIALQKAYEEKGFATVSVSIPEQGVESGVIRLDVQAQTIGTVAVTGGKHTSPDWVLRRAPSLAAGGIPNFKTVQRDVVVLNSNASRRVTPEVKAGVAPGTIDVVLKVEDSLPIHGSVEVNNNSSASTTDLRVAATLRYDNLWGRGDSISVSAQTAPRRSNDGTIFSANYLAHVGRIQLLGYFVHSDSDIAIIGGTSVIGKGDLGGARVIVPLGSSEGFYHALTAGIDYKNFKEDVRLGADRSTAPIEYFPVTIGWRGDWTGERAKSNLSFTSTFGVRGLGDDQPTFDFKRYKARPDFFYVRAEATTTHEVWAGFQAYAHLTGQYSAAPLISNEQFSVGGIDTVRGYYESETLGDFGYAAQFEIRSPRLFPGLVFIDDLRLHGFADSGYSGIRDSLSGQTGHSWLASAGGGVRLKIFKYLNGSFDVGVPLRDGPDSRANNIFTKFRLSGEF